MAISPNIHDRELGKFRDVDGLPAVAITGANSNGSVDVVDGLSGGGVYGSIDMPLANVAYEAMVGVSPLTNRKIIYITVMTSNMFFGLDNSVTILTGTPVAQGQVLSFTLDPSSNFRIFLISSNINGSFKIIEVP
jgi:hypothetical protein